MGCFCAFWFPCSELLFCVWLVGLFLFVLDDIRSPIFAHSRLLFLKISHSLWWPVDLGAWASLVHHLQTTFAGSFLPNLCRAGEPQVKFHLHIHTFLLGELMLLVFQISLLYKWIGVFPMHVFTSHRLCIEQMLYSSTLLITVDSGCPGRYEPGLLDDQGRQRDGCTKSLTKAPECSMHCYQIT